MAALTGLANFRRHVEGFWRANELRNGLTSNAASPIESQFAASTNGPFAWRACHGAAAKAHARTGSALRSSVPIDGAAALPGRGLAATGHLARAPQALASPPPSRPTFAQVKPVSLHQLARLSAGRGAGLGPACLPRGQFSRLPPAICLPELQADFWSPIRLAEDPCALPAISRPALPKACRALPALSLRHKQSPASIAAPAGRKARHPVTGSSTARATYRR